MSTIDQQFVEYVVKSLVRVIGKRGVTAQSLRTLLRALGTKNDARYNLKIVNNDDERESYETPTSEEVVKNLTEEDVDNESSLTKNTRKELAELDDLDI
jgi:HEPN domain-containing protein